MMASVLRQDIDWTRLPADTPDSMRGLLQRCLERDPKRRLRDVGEARIALATSGDEPIGRRRADSATVMAPAPSSSSTRSSKLPWAVAIGATLVAAALATAIARKAWTSAPPAAPLMVEIGPPQDQEFVVGRTLARRSSLRMAPWSRSSRRDLGPPALRPLAGDRRGAGDSGNAGRALSLLVARQPVAGLFRQQQADDGIDCRRAPEAVADIQQGRGGTWTDAGDILFTLAAAAWCTASRRAGDRRRRSPRSTHLAARTRITGQSRSGRPETSCSSSAARAREQRHLSRLGGQTPSRYAWSRRCRAVCYAPPRGNAGPPAVGPRRRPARAAAGYRFRQADRRREDRRVRRARRGESARNVCECVRHRTPRLGSRACRRMRFAWYQRNGHRLDDVPVPARKSCSRISRDGRKLAFTRAWVARRTSGCTTSGPARRLR